jgi:hypothetical protein
MKLFDHLGFIPKSVWSAYREALFPREEFLPFLKHNGGDCQAREVEIFA